MRLRMAKVCLSAVAVEWKLRDDRAGFGNAPEQFRVLRREHDVDARAEHANRPAFCRQRALMRRRVNPARAAAHDRHADIGQLIRQLARGLDAVMRRHARADHCHGVFVLRGQFAFDVKHQRRVVNFPERFGIILVALNQNVAAEILDAFQFAGEVNRFLPTGNRLGGFVADVADAEQFGSGTPKNLGRVAEMFQQQPCAHRADMLDEVQRDESFPGIHAELKSFKFQVSSSKFVGDEVTSLKLPQNESETPYVVSYY